MLYLLASFLILISLIIGNAAIAIFLGILFTIIVDIPNDFITKRAGAKLLQIAIVLIGSTISISSALDISISYFQWISIFVITTFFLGLKIGNFLGVGKKQAFLLASGTAICGGTAMLAVAPIIKSKPEELSMAISIVFLLNAIAVVTFPLMAQILELSEIQAGTWFSLAIHDTASVIGAASISGEESLKVATTLKLGRTLWLIPLVIFSGWYFKEPKPVSSFPFFIIFFLIAIICNSFLAPYHSVILLLSNINKLFLIIGLFCIGTQIDKSVLRSLKAKPILLSLLLWALVVPASLFVVFFN